MQRSNFSYNKLDVELFGDRVENFTELLFEHNEANPL